MKTESIILENLESAMIAISELAERSAWFCFEPFPDDQYRIEFKAGEGHYEFLTDFLGDDEIE